jgi:hypothetical protein
LGRRKRPKSKYKYKYKYGNWATHGENLAPLGPGWANVGQLDGVSASMHNEAPDASPKSTSLPIQASAVGGAPRHMCRRVT